MIQWENERKMLEQRFAFLQALSFHGPDAGVVASKLVGDSLLLRYDNAALKRQINIAYSKGSERTNRSIVITILAGKLSFLLDDYLNSIGRSEFQPAFAGSPNGATEAEFVDAAAAAFQKIATGPLARTLAGLEWPSVDFDWKGMR